MGESIFSLKDVKANTQLHKIKFAYIEEYFKHKQWCLYCIWYSTYNIKNIKDKDRPVAIGIIMN